MNYIAGIDVGSGKTKAVILNENHDVCARVSLKTTARFSQLGHDIMEAALLEAKISENDIRYVAATGLGRCSIPFRDIQITEITCAARGAKFLLPDVHCVLDIGAQSTRAIKLRDSGKVHQFRTNDKCAAGSGGFLERAARYLEVTVEQVGSLSLKAQNPQTISSICAVLGESEIINHVSNGSSVADILRGVHDSLADRAIGLLKRVGIEGRLAFVGGVARHAGMIKTLEEKLGSHIFVCPRPEYTCALGAALLGLHRWKKVRNQLAITQEVS